ncbi:hypothetical protein V7S43_010625 [Phytophthora oleae]|uniref:Uncharacterized protein n=1 Tax=Phytophthora oleae TaxID=2107226 RepID=A0ABD3FC06_9STRA
MLATSQQPDLKDSELEYAYRCLLPSWKKQDLFELGREVYKFQEENMVNRFFSDGSVREFTKESGYSLKKMQITIANACTHVEKAYVVAGSDPLCHIFIKDTQDPDNYLCSLNWVKMIDLEYAVELLTLKLRLKELLHFFHWARGPGYDALTSTIFEICLYRLGLDNDLILHVSEYDPLKTKEEQHVDRSEDSYDEEELKQWRDDDKLSYWYPIYNNFPKIGVIVKLKPCSPDKKSQVAFLRIAIGIVDDKRLELRQGIFTAVGADPSIYIVLCPDLASSDKLPSSPAHCT